MLVCKSFWINSGAKDLKKLKSELFLNREGNDEVLYYSCKAHLDELINSLEEDGKEKKLLSMIKAKYKVMIKQMEITETLTEELRGMDDSVRLHDVHVTDLMQEKSNNSLALSLPNDKTNIGGYVHMVILAIHI